VRRLNRYVEEQAPWTLAKDDARAGDLDRVLASLSEGLRVVAVMLHPWLPETTGRLLAALGSEDISLEGSRMQAGRLGQVSQLDQLFPKHEQPSPAT
jgi:methionyl-tRNA synthetase